MPRVKQPRVKAFKAVKAIKVVKTPDNEKQTCKVVKRRNATGGYTGARIDPKGCKVRTTTARHFTQAASNHTSQKTHRTNTGCHIH